jgi:tRNA(Ile)-lysidine synthase
MLKKFTKHIETNFPFLHHSRFYIAVSGGIDSMVLVHLFQHFKYEFGLLHCNFKLRGEESDADMRFVADYADENNLNLRIGFFQTYEIAKELKISIQVAARELRYKWFYEQMEEKNAQYVATAHHLDDNLETFIINLTRGTGLDGLTGIPAINKQIIRPLLPFSREEIEEYAKENNIQWREDSSNASDKYLRNKIRHNLIPILKEINPLFLDSFQKTQNFLNDAESIINDGQYIIYKEIATEKEDGTIYFNLNKLLTLSNYKAYLYQWLKEYDFTAWEDIYSLVASQSGKQIFSKNYRLLKDRDFLILSALQEVEKDVYFIEKDQKEVKIPLNISICNIHHISTPKNTLIFVDEDKLQFPLTIRKWNEGDSFYPSGMNGKKKLSKYFKDEKMSLIEKENTWLLCSNNQIVWVIGKRADQQFIANKTTKNIIQLELL